MTEAEFSALAALGYNRIPLVLETFADLDTPLSLYIKLANQRYTFLLESVVGGERFGRYSFIGLPAKLRLRARGREIKVENDDGTVEHHHGDPLAFIGDFLRRYRAAPRPGLPRFCGGLAGYFGYDTVRHIETKLADSAHAASLRRAAAATLPRPALGQSVAVHVLLRFRRLSRRWRVARDPGAQGSGQHHAASDRRDAPAWRNPRGR